MRKRQLKKVQMQSAKPAVFNLNAFQDKLKKELGQPNLKVKVDLRKVGWQDLVTADAEKFKAFLNAQDIRFTDKCVHGETYNIECDIDGFEVNMWYERKFTVEDKIAKLKNELRELGEEV